MRRPAENETPPNETSKPEDATHPDRLIILWRNDARRGRTVVACCERAARCGVRAGRPIAQAVEWVSHLQKQATDQRRASKQAADKPAPPPMPPLVLEHDVVADSVAIEELAGMLQQKISPLVAIETLEKRPWAGRMLNEPDTLFCDLSGVTHLFADQGGVFAATHRVLREFGLTAKLAIAENAAAAWALAHYHPERDFQSLDSADLNAVPVEGLRIETETKHTLGRLGIETIGALLRLPRSGLASRLGTSLMQRIAEVLGEREVSLAVHHPEVDYRAVHELEYASDDLQLLGDRVERLTVDLTSQLREQRRGAVRVHCQLDLVEHTPRELTIGLFAPTQDEMHLAGLIQCSLESIRLPSLVTKLTLRVLQSGSMRTQQQGLFAESTSELDPQSVSAQRLARLVDSLSTRLGADAVLGIRLSENPLPEKAYRTYRLTDYRTRRALKRLPAKKIARRTSSKSGTRYRPPAQTDARRRPLKLLRRPVPLHPVAGGDSREKLDHDPVAFRLDRDVHRIASCWGPERIESGWWEGPSVRRNYYRVETTGGRVWWIFQDINSRDWFLHGRFA